MDAVVVSPPAEASDTPPPLPPKPEHLKAEDPAVKREAEARQKAEAKAKMEEDKRVELEARLKALEEGQAQAAADAEAASRAEKYYSTLTDSRYQDAR